MVLCLFLISFYEFFNFIICFYLTNSLGSFYFVYLLLANAVLSFFIHSFSQSSSQHSLLSCFYFHSCIPETISPSDNPSIWPSIYLSLYLSIYQTTYLSTCISIHLFSHLYIFLSIYLPFFLSIFLSVHLSVCLSAYLPTCPIINLYI